MQNSFVFLLVLVFGTGSAEGTECTVITLLVTMPFGQIQFESEKKSNKASIRYIYIFYGYLEIVDAVFFSF